MVLLLYFHFPNPSMGNILGMSPEQMEDPHSNPELKITLYLDRPVHTELRQLLHWSLSEIRNIYAPFRKRKSSPLLTRSEFLRFLRLSRISAFHIHDVLCEQA